VSREQFISYAVLLAPAVCARREQAGIDAARAVGVEREQGLAWLSGVRDGAHLLYLHQLVSTNPNLIAYQVRLLACTLHVCFHRVLSVHVEMCGCWWIIVWELQSSVGGDASEVITAAIDVNCNLKSALRCRAGGGCHCCLTHHLCV
jgi:hypothetical protein